MATTDTPLGTQPAPGSMPLAQQPLQQPPPMMIMQSGPPMMIAGSPPQQVTTTTILNTPVMINDWQTGICDCFSDLNVCCMSCCCPCVIYGQVERLLQTNGMDSTTDYGQCSMCCCVSYLGNAVLAFIGLPGIVHAFFICGQRRRFRMRGNIIGGDCEDAAWSCCCPHCALGQVYLEETRYKVLSRNPLGLAPAQQIMMAGAPGPQVTVVNNQPPMYAQAQPMPMYAAGQSVYAAPPQPQGYGQPVYAQPPAGGYYAQPQQQQPPAAAVPPQYYQPQQ